MAIQVATPADYKSLRYMVARRYKRNEQRHLRHRMRKYLDREQAFGFATVGDLVDTLAMMHVFDKRKRPRGLLR